MRVVMVCTGNTCRSPMAEALMRKALRDRGIKGIEVLSCGLWAQAGDVPCENAVRAAEELGAQTPACSRQATPEILQDALVLGMTRSHVMGAKAICSQCDAHVLGEWSGVGGEVPDPFGSPIEVYRQTARVLQKMCDAAAVRMGERLGGFAP